ncbi:MAG: ABC transporter ATP-binding protein [Saccharospirillum sp.]
MSCAITGTMTVVELQAVSFRHPNSRDADAFALNIPHLSIAAGEKVAIVGPSGAGKTTLLNLISGLYRPNAGTVRVLQTDVSALPDADRRRFRLQHLGLVFQDFELLDYLNALDNILLPCRINQGLALTPALRARAQALAESAGIGALLGRHPADLSQGEKQRVALCRALLSTPQVILADEATGNLDPVNKERIMALLVERAQADNATLLAVTHDHNLLHWFDRVIDFDTFLHREPSNA